jgi:hypothetical protein
MIGLDTNILIRYLTQDDEQQWQQAVTLNLTLPRTIASPTPANSPSLWEVIDYNLA